MTETTPGPLGNVITIDDERIKSHLDRVVRGSVEALHKRCCIAQAGRPRRPTARSKSRSEARRDTRAGHYERNLHTRPARCG